MNKIIPIPNVDFAEIISEPVQRGKVQEIRVSLLVDNDTKDLMIAGKSFKAAYLPDKHIWSTNRNDIIKVLDAAVKEEAKLEKKEGLAVSPKYFRIADSGMIDKWNKYVNQQMVDNYKELDSQIIFADTELTREHYATKRLPYSLSTGDCPAFKELIGTLYDERNANMLLWAIGSVFTGASKNIQKCIIIYGPPKSGKSTILNILEMLVGIPDGKGGYSDGYWTTFNFKEATSKSNAFAMELIGKKNPLVAIQHDGDLSKIEDNTILNSFISHEYIEVNPKNQSKYSAKFNTMLFMGTNTPVKITDSKSGLLRRILDVNPSGKTIPVARYNKLMKAVEFELGAIANYCIQVFTELGPNYYDSYVPISMFSETNDFYYFMQLYYKDFVTNDGTTLMDAYRKYNNYCEMANVKYKLSMQAFGNELKSYFNKWDSRCYVDGERVRNYYSGFKKEKFEYQTDEERHGLPTPEDLACESDWLIFKPQSSIFDVIASEYPAQYAASPDGGPEKAWDISESKLNEIDTKKLHFVRMPVNHIVIDFDLKEDDKKTKSLKRNLEAASKFPPTYAELSKSGNGIHLHYFYDGDPTKLSIVYDTDIEVKVFNGKSSLRRMLTMCNDSQIAHINSGLPMKPEKPMIDKFTLKNEEHLINIIKRNLNKEYPPHSTATSINYIYNALEQAYNQEGFTYDVRLYERAINTFASLSHNQHTKCLKLVSKMHFKSEEEPTDVISDKRLALSWFDVEVYPNFFLISYMVEGEDDDIVHDLINPTPEEVTNFVYQYSMIGFNNRRYDNHILYHRMRGASNEELFKISQRIINAEKGSRDEALVLNAYNMSYTDIYDYAVNKQSLKHWEIELGIHHQEMGIPWDKPVPDELIPKVIEYCHNDVRATKAVWEHTQSDFKARQIIAALSGLSVNETTNKHSARIIFGNNRNPQSEFVYTDLSTIFPGYSFDAGKSHYMGEEIGEGGYVYYEEGMYGLVKCFDITSMHPHSAKALNMFGPYTKTFYDLVKARVYIKRGDFDKAGELFDGKLKPYLTDKDQAKELANALKIVINSVYGQTCAKYANPFRDPHNVDNICAKYGELFMVTLKHELQNRGVQVIHCKTDSIKIPNPSKETEDFIIEFGRKYGFEFEVENVYSKFCIVNGSTYIAQHEDGSWEAKAAQFAVPYVFKTLFSKEPIMFEDYCETKAVKSTLYLDYDENLPENEHNYSFIGRIGLFCPIKEGYGGGRLVVERPDRKTGGVKYDSVQNTTGYRWLEAEQIKDLPNWEDMIDKSYYISQVDKALEAISQYGDAEAFRN